MEVLSAKRNDMKDVGVQFMDEILKGLLAWKSVEGRGLLRWGDVVLQKPVGGRARWRAAGVACFNDCFTRRARRRSFVDTLF